MKNPVCVLIANSRITRAVVVGKTELESERKVSYDLASSSSKCQTLSRDDISL